MLETLTSRLQTIFQGLSRRGRLSPEDVDAALREIRLALLEADVHFAVVKDLLERVRSRSVGTEVSRALNPAQQVVKIVREELVATLGPRGSWTLSGPKPRVVLLAGLQGSGKTTTAAKLAFHFQQEGERVLLVAADPYRPAAVEQLQKLGQGIGVPVYAGGRDAVEVCRAAVAQARRGGDSLVLLDTAGRMQLDQAMMAELAAIREAVHPGETLLVVDAMTGQEAVRIAEGFNRTIGLTGLVLAKLDGDARGGAAISMRAATGIPICWVGVGEGIEALELFEPERLASRILGLGDVLGLIEKAERAYEAREAGQQAQRLAQGEFTLEDMVEQMSQMRKLGPLSQIIDNLPAGGGPAARLPAPEELDRQMRRLEAILLSMTPAERRDPDVLNASRKRRIARGSGTEVQEVNRMLKQFREAQRLMRQMRRPGLRGVPRVFG